MAKFLTFDIGGSVDFEIVESILADRTSGGVLKVIEEDWSLFRLRFEIEPDFFGNNLTGAKIMAHRAEYGIKNAFTMPMPQHLGINVPSGTQRLSVASAARDTSIRVILSGSSSPIQTGAFFTVAGDAKVFMALNDLSATGTLKIYPAMRKALARNAQLDFTPDIKVRYSPSNNYIAGYRAGAIFTKTIEVEEVLD